MKRLWISIPAIIFAQWANDVAAQATDRISTDRPSFSATPFVLSPGVWQIESGYQYSHDDSDSNFQTLPQALLRFGLNDEIELDFGIPSLAWRDSEGGTDSGLSDSSFGVKIQLTDDTAATPVAFLAGVSLPTGDDEFSSDSFDPMIGAAWSHSRFFGMATITLSDGDYSFDNGVGMHFALKERTSAYAEWHMTIPDSGGSVQRLNGGWLWSPRNNMQWDAHASLGLNDRAPDFSLGGGFSYRF